jgi:opacity protein-like surface antigen
MRRILLPLAALLLAAPARATAQTPVGPIPLKFTGGATLMAIQPLGDFGRRVNVGGGFGGHGLLRLDGAGALALRLDGGFVVYGSERVRANNPISGRVKLEVQTTNGIAMLGAGPQIMLPRGRVRPYANAGVGLALFTTYSSLRGGDEYGTPFAETTNERDATFAFMGGAGLYLPVANRGRTVSLDVGARYHANGTATYLTEGGLVDNPNGTVTERPFHTRADFLAYPLFVSVGF